jgi:CheY-like chemotaxis protein
MGVGGGRRRVLVVDDEESIRRALRRILSKQWEVAEAASGIEALGALASGEFHAVLCDLTMPLMDGMELYSRIETDRPDLADHVLFVTGGAMTSAAGAFLQRFPADRVVAKPFDIDQLLAVLTRVARPS